MEPLAEWVLEEEKHASDVSDEVLDICCDSRGGQEARPESEKLEEIGYMLGCAGFFEKKLPRPIRKLLRTLL